LRQQSFGGAAAGKILGETTYQITDADLMGALRSVTSQHSAS
jgi:hypothetical protein